MTDRQQTGHKRKRGRPSNQFNYQLKVRLRISTLELLRQLAEKKRIPTSTMVRHWIEDRLQDEKPK